MTDQDKEYADLQQLYGDFYTFADFPRGAHVQYIAFDGQVRSGTIIWCQEPGTAIGKDGKRMQFKAQYIIDPDVPRGMPDFVDLGAVLSE